MRDASLSLVLLGGEPSLERELADAAAALDGLAVLPPTAADRAAVAIVADGPSGAGLDLVRAEARARPGRPVLLVGGATTPVDQAMAAGARALLRRPLRAAGLRAALDALGPIARDRARSTGRLVVVLGAAGGAGTTTCAAALAAACAGVLVDLDLAAGDAAEAAGASVAAPDALLALTAAPTLGAGEVEAQLAAAPAGRVLAAPQLPEQADLIDEVGVARLLDALLAGGASVIVDGGQRVGLETVPALERASAIVVVAPEGARGAAGGRRLVGLLERLGLADRPTGAVVGRAGRDPRAAARLAEELGVPLWGAVRSQRRIAVAREREQPPPAAPFRAVVDALAGVAPA